MAAFFADENFPLQVVEAVRRLGHDVLTTSEAGQSGKAVSDREILDLAVSLGRAVLTLNRRPDDLAAFEERQREPSRDFEKFVRSLKRRDRI